MKYSKIIKILELTLYNYTKELKFLVKNEKNLTLPKMKNHLQYRYLLLGACHNITRNKQIKSLKLNIFDDLFLNRNMNYYHGCYYKNPGTLFWVMPAYAARTKEELFKTMEQRMAILTLEIEYLKDL